MRQTVGVVNIGSCCNIFNILKSLKFISARTLVVETPEDLGKVDKIILPGVGNFKNAITDLKKRELFVPLSEAVKNKPTMGICLGMHILAEYGYEDGKTRGLGAFPGEVHKMDTKLEIPHLGWKKIKSKSDDNPLLQGITPEQEFYFMHSYEFKNPEFAIATSTYCGQELISVIAKDNIYGLQFHPEKSRSQGIRILVNFYNI